MFRHKPGNRFIIVSFLRANRFMGKLLTRYQSSRNRQVKHRESSTGVSGLEYLSINYRRFYEIYRKYRNLRAVKSTDNRLIFSGKRPILAAGSGLFSLLSACSLAYPGRDVRLQRVARQCLHAMLTLRLTGFLQLGIAWQPERKTDHREIVAIFLFGDNLCDWCVTGM
jgi:hypothetical protein